MIPVADTQALMGITFWAGAQRYALPIDRVREIQRIVAFAEVPDETGLVLGMVNVRGEIVPVVDIRTLIGLQREPYTLDTPMIIMLGAIGPVALIVDAIDTVIDLPAEGAGSAPALHSLASRILGVHHVGDGLVFVLDADALLEPVEHPASGESADE